jgi:hypothetical protein
MYILQILSVIEEPTASLDFALFRIDRQVGENSVTGPDGPSKTILGVLNPVELRCVTYLHYSKKVDEKCSKNHQDLI